MEAGDGYARHIFWLLAAALVIGSFALRMRHADLVLRGDGAIRFEDNDTLRRLDRMRAVDAAESYPVTEVKDGFPAGTVGHWTLPFDWCLRILDPVARPFVRGAKGHEAAAVLAGPILGTLCVLLFLWFAVRWLGRFPGLLAAGFYAVQYPLLSMTAAGNGDHQNLQHLFLLVFGATWLLQLAGRLGTRAAPVGGAALGMGIWVSTESMVLFLAYVAITAVDLLLRPPTRARLRPELHRTAALIGTLLVGAACEQASFAAVEWDKVSWFQIYPVLVFGAFLALAGLERRVPGQVWIAAAAALGAGLLGLLTGFGTAVGGQLARFEQVNVWLQTCVSEFRPSFWTGYDYALAPGLRRFTPVFLGLPVFLAAVLVARPLAAPARIPLAALTAISFALAAWEVKLSHLFAIFLPVTVVIGAMVLRQRVVPAAGPLRVAATLVFAALLLVSGLLGAPERPGLVVTVNSDARHELCGFLRQQRGNRDGSVLAPWDLAGSIMYQADWPVVASGYHRNLEGILDGYRAFSAQPEESEAVAEILRRRQVRFVVAWYSRTFLQDAQTVLGSGRVFIEIQGRTQRFTELARNSLFWRLRYQQNLPGFRLCHQCSISVPLGGGKPEPLFKIYEVAKQAP